RRGNKMKEPNFECKMCKRDLLLAKSHKYVVIDGSPEVICNYCNNKYTPDEIKSVTVMANLGDKTLIKEYDLILFLNNNFTEKDIEDYLPNEKNKLYKYLNKILGVQDAIYSLQINITKRRLNKCELCDKLLDFEESIYFKTGKKNNFIQVCKECANK
ncbi:MAG: hypothetical protein WC996_07740, partial [Peptostreptococcales bacterium]